MTLWIEARSVGSVPGVELNVSTSSQGGHTVVTATGELDLYTAPRLQAALADLPDDAADRITVDLSGVEFCDSTGMNVLLAAMQRVRDGGGSFALAAPRTAVRRILQVTGLDTVFTVVDAAPVPGVG
ncbi:anti-sigma factor antagonist [Actinomadura rayongensis]|uniref:Anti-sigma factor antagonist n=1 Tax=Actinomadura rayongensis TaxID=1429076 RepID=A0A6I4WBE2_9ACTN|nr:STAS domain-containing protein [Actinomadura rayongensis]MXQ65346.1 anti-sigma factor antagonist [Actinomadura rayongensis]